MQKQKRMALVNDISGFGRCSITVELPLVSALKVQGCVLPTAILSVHTAFPSFYLDDYTPHMTPYIENWKQNHVEFDGILTGFFGSLDQIAIVEKFIQDFKREDTLAFIDPVMGDGGKLYPSYTDAMANAMRGLLPVADLITPNLTEACNLLSEDFPTKTLTNAELFEMAEALSTKGPKEVIITGVEDGKGNLRNIVYVRGEKPQALLTPKIGGDRHGTGDVFAPIVAASRLRGEDVFQATAKAAAFIDKTIRYTDTLGIPGREGLAFEEFMTELR